MIAELVARRSVRRGKIRPLRARQNEEGGTLVVEVESLLEGVQGEGAGEEVGRVEVGGNVGDGGEAGGENVLATVLFIGAQATRRREPGQGDRGVAVELGLGDGDDVVVGVF